MRTLQGELISLIQLRLNYVRIIASLKFLLNKPIYVPSVEKEQCHHAMGMALQLNLNIQLVKKFMRVVCKISRESQRKMYRVWSIEKGTCAQFLSNHIHYIPMLRSSTSKNMLGILDACAFYEHRFHLIRLFIRFIDLQIICLLSSLTEKLSLSFLKEQLAHCNELPKDTLLYKFFLLMNEFVNKEGLCC